MSGHTGHDTPETVNINHDNVNYGNANYGNVNYGNVNYGNVNTGNALFVGGTQIAGTNVFCAGFDSQGRSDLREELGNLHFHDGFAYKYDVALSYASEQETLVKQVAKILEAEKLSVFFAPNREGAFLADDMVARFYQIYRYECRFAAAFVTEDYLRKKYTMHEAKSAMLRGRDEDGFHLIPILFGNAVLPGLDGDICRIHGDGLDAVEIAEKIRLIICGR